ncbi:MAG: AAA family ATPase [Bacteroidetes bacterium]|nr:MAG: AAA family ATPase [Bacteroidota bacterium]
MDELLEKSDLLVSRVSTTFKRYLYDQITWNNRLTGIKGPRGTGKTTLLLQRLKEIGKSPTQAAYFSLDDLFFTINPLTEVAGDFYKRGGKHLFLDEVHKFPGWAKQIKNLYDFYPDLQIVFTGSSIIDIAREQGDLSRRSRIYELQGLSYREYLSFTNKIHLNPFSLKTILADPATWKSQFPTDFRPLEHFAKYLELGYYPFFPEDPEGMADRIQQLIRTVVEYDMAELHDFDIRNAKKMLQLLYILSTNVPFKPVLTQLAEKSQIHRNTINNYLHFLEQARLIRLLYAGGNSIATLQKPEKIYLDNTNIAYALSGKEPEKGNLRETFFLSQLATRHAIHYPHHGDFLVDNRWTFEIGGKNKSKKQIKDTPDSFLVQDDLEYPVSSIPLWLFGFLY